MKFNLLASEHSIAWFIALFLCSTIETNFYINFLFLVLRPFQKFSFIIPVQWGFFSHWNLSDNLLMSSRVHISIINNFPFVKYTLFIIFFFSQCNPEDELRARNIYRVKKIFIQYIFNFSPCETPPTPT